MSISFENALGIHESALAFRTKRAEVLAANIANVDTPNYLARDIDFSTVLGQQLSGSRMTATRDRHYGANVFETEPDLQYRMPMQPSLDGNTVEEQVELSRYAKNSLDFMASFRFLNSKFKGLRTAIGGGN